MAGKEAPARIRDDRTISDFPRREVEARAPCTLDAARHLAAEHWAFCREFGGIGLHDVRGISESLLSSPIWTFWWD